MSHPNDDQLLLHAYGELPGSEGAELDAHLAACPTCRVQLERLERSRVALDVATRRPRRYVARWIGAALAAAAVIAAVLLTDSQPPRPDGGWQPASVWSATAGYVAGGTVVVDIDAQLTRLEQESRYGRP